MEIKHCENSEEETPRIHANVVNVLHGEIGKDEAILSLIEVMEKVRNKVEEICHYYPRWVGVGVEIIRIRAILSSAGLAYWN